MISLSLDAPPSLRFSGARRPPRRGWTALCTLAALLCAGNLAAQDAPREAGSAGEWNDSRVLELVERGRDARRDLVLDGDLESYRALTEGHIYFFVDPEEGERALIRADQVAVELRWRAPDQVQQHIVGERTETRLPVREFRYYLDRLTLVQYGFGDEIQVGSGMDVAGVPHPLAPVPEGDPDGSPYDFRLADSLTVSLPGRPEPVRLYEVEVRPRSPDAPGILGRITLDRATASIVRMAFTFTPASYVDRRTDRISVELDYGLWEERYWLPNRQRIEVRRELPELDLGVGTVIRAVLRVGNYELNVPFHDMPVLVPGRVTAAPREAREAYPFPEGLYDGLDRHGLADLVLEVDPRELRARAMELMRDRALTGLSPVRLHLPRISEAVRFNRAEGLYLGAGGSWRPREDLRVRLHGGAALGEGLPRGALRVDGLVGEEAAWWTAAEVNLMEDLGMTPGADPLLSTLGALARGEDYLDPWRVSAIRAGLELSLPRDFVLELRAGGERHRSMERVQTSAPLDDARAFRPVRPVSDGGFVHGGAGVRRSGIPFPAGGTGNLALAADLRTGSPGTGVGLDWAVGGRWGPASGIRETRLALHGWSWLGDLLPQGHRLMGGRGTLPGFPYRSFGGAHAVRGSLAFASDLWGPHLRLRTGLHAAWIGGGDGDVLGAWEATGSRTVKASGTAGFGVLWDLFRVEVARGLNGGEWQLLLSLDPRWWDWL